MTNKPNYEELEAYVEHLEKKVIKALRTEKINKILFEIASALNATDTLQELYQSIHQILSKLMDMTNFYISIYYKEKNAIRFVYKVDIRDTETVEWIHDFTQNRSLTGDVILAKKAVLLKEKELLRLGRENRIKGPVPKIWLGVPLMIKEQVLGVMAVQSYTNPDQFTQSDVEVLSFVSDQVALSIEKKRDEELLRKTQEKLIQSEKLEAIGTLAGGIAHDFNNTLSITLGNINLAQLMSKDPELRQMLADAETSIMQAKALASKFIVFSKGGLLSKKKVEAEDFLKTTLASIAREKGIPYTLKIENVPRIIEIDPQQLKEALKSVVVNAHESMAKKDAVTILFNAHPVKADVVVISVLDQGKGIEKENIERVFDPYYSTKPLGKDKGTGLGMSIAYSIIKSHQGEILMTSTLNQGTKVDIILPVYQKKEFLQMDKIVSAQAGPECEENSQRVKVLIMDDDQMIREISAKILTKLGYEPIVAKDGEQAVQFFQQYLEKGEVINFAILDLEVKQGMGGAKAIKKLLPINPDLKAIIASGYSSDKIMENCQDYGFALALSKPFTMNTLKEALAQLQ